MIRLFAFVSFVGFAISFATLIASLGAARGRNEHTYRPSPRWNWWFEDGARAEPGTMHLVRRFELEGLRDAYSSAPLNPGEPLLRCGTCLAMYHATSVHELDRTNAGRCVVCGRTELAAVHVAEG